MAWQLDQWHGGDVCHEVYMFVVVNVIEGRKIFVGTKLLTQNFTLSLRIVGGVSCHEVEFGM